jgi:hypothetical protein
VRATTELTPGRQRIRGYVQGNTFRYGDYSYLNWEGIDFGAAWLWQLGDRWNGNLSYDHVKFLSGLADLRAFVQNLRTVQIPGGAEYWLHPRWRLTGGYTGTFIQNSGDDLQHRCRHERLRAGFAFVPTRQNYDFGATIDGNYPNRSRPTIIGDTGFAVRRGRRPLGAGGKAEVRGNLAYTRREFDLSQRDSTVRREFLRWRATNARPRPLRGSGDSDVTATTWTTPRRWRPTGSLRRSSGSGRRIISAARHHVGEPGRDRSSMSARTGTTFSG